MNRKFGINLLLMLLVNINGAQEPTNNGTQWSRIVDKVEELISSLHLELNQLRGDSGKSVSPGTTY